MTTTTVEPITATVVATTSAYDLNVLLSGAVPFAGEPDYGHPTLQCVRVEAGGGVICASATDRYHLGHVRRPAAGDLAPVYLRRDVAEEIIARLDARATFIGSADEQVKLSVSGDRLLIEVGDHVMRPRAEEVGVWPDLGRLLAKGTTGSHDTEGPVGIGTNSLKVLIEALEGMDRPLSVLRWKLGGPKSAVVAEYHDWFVALFMPCVNTGGEAPPSANVRVPYGLPSA